MPRFLEKIMMILPDFLVLGGILEILIIFLPRFSDKMCIFAASK
jgi:hypothetical protein